MAGKFTKGDTPLLSHIAEYKFLTVKQLVALSQRPTQVVRKRLRFLAKEGFVALNERGIGQGQLQRNFKFNVIAFLRHFFTFQRSQLGSKPPIFLCRWCYQGLIKFLYVNFSTISKIQLYPISVDYFKF